MISEKNHSFVLYLREKSTTDSMETSIMRKSPHHKLKLLRRYLIDLKNNWYLSTQSTLVYTINLLNKDCATLHLSFFDKRTKAGV